RRVAETLVARPLLHRLEVAVADAQAEPDAVVAGQVGGGLGRRDQIVAGHAVLDRARQLALPQLGAELAAECDRGVDRGLDAGLDAFRLVELARDADAQAADVP